MVRLLTALLLAVAVPALPALAKNEGHPGKGPPSRGDGGRDHDEWRDDHHEGDHHEGDHHEGDRHEWERDHHGGDWRRFSDHDRRWWREYWRDQYAHGHCPPGLAKKHNGCLPPGHAKRRYVIGRPLPRDVVIVPVPTVLLGRLPPIEHGYRYGMVDGDLVKLAVGTSLVVDAMNGLME